MDLWLRQGQSFWLGSCRGSVVGGVGETGMPRRLSWPLLGCQKGGPIEAFDPHPHRSPLDEVIGNEDLAFLVASYLCPNRNPSRLLNLCHNLCFVSKQWNEAFSLTRAQLRYDYLIKCLSEDDDNTLFHKVSFHEGGEKGHFANGVGGRWIPREGTLTIHRSHCTKTFDVAAKEYRDSRRNDPHSRSTRRDSRPDYFYRAHIEKEECVELVLPRPLVWNETIHLVNEIQHDEKPRLINRFSACIGDINGAQNNAMAGGSKSSEGQWDLGYHEIQSVAYMSTTSCHSRPPLGGHGEDSTEFLRAVRATPSDDPRWVKLCHLVGEDRCRLWLNKHLLPVLGPRPSGNSWKAQELGILVLPGS